MGLVVNVPCARARKSKGLTMVVKMKKLLLLLSLLPLMAVAELETVGTVTWCYTVENGEATVGGPEYFGRAIYWEEWEVEDDPDYDGDDDAEGSHFGTSWVGPESVDIPSTLGGYPVTGIGEDAFGGGIGLTSVTIPASVTSIGHSAFDGCSGLSSITIPSSVTSIGNSAFCDCSGLTTVVIPPSVTSIGWSAFELCPLLFVYVEVGDSARVKALLADSEVDVGLIRFKEIGSTDVVPVAPGVPVVFESQEGAAKAAKQAVFSPDAEVAAALCAGEELDCYCAKFGFGVAPLSGGHWAVEAVLLPEAWTSVAQSARLATQQIPVSAIADGKTPVAMSVANCVPGFYYSLCVGGTLETIAADPSSGNCNILCGADGVITFPGVSRPADSTTAAFFSVVASTIPL